MSNGVGGYNWNNASYQALYSQLNTNTGALNKEEGIDEDELKRSGKYNEEAFKEADTNGSGVLSAAEFEKYMALYNSSSIATPTNTNTGTTNTTGTTGTTGTTSTTGTTGTTGTDDTIDAIMAIYDKNHDGELDGDEAFNLLNDLSNAYATVDQTTTGETTTEPVVSEPEVSEPEVSEPEDPTAKLVNQRIVEISTYIAQAANNTSNELGMYLALEFVGDNVDLKKEVINRLGNAATDYIKANPDNENAVEDFIKNQLMVKYNEIKAEVLANSPAQKKEDAIDLAYVFISGSIPENITGELKAAVEKELKAQLIAEANRYTKACDNVFEVDTLATHLQNYFTEYDSVTLENEINAFRTQIGELYGEDGDGIIGSDTDQGKLRGAVMTFLRSAVLKGISVEFNGKTISKEGDIYNAINSIKDADSLKAAIDECIESIENGTTRIDSIITKCLNNTATSVMTENNFKKTYDTIKNDISKLTSQFKSLTDASTIASASSAKDFINEFLNDTYEVKDKDGNVVETHESRADYLLSILKKVVDDIEEKIGQQNLENCTEYLDAKEKYNEVKDLVDAAKDEAKYKKENLAKEYLTVLGKKATNSTESVVSKTTPSEITNDTTYILAQKSGPGTYDVKDKSLSEVTEAAYNYLSTFKSAVERTLNDTLRELFGNNIPTEIAQIKNNAFYDAVRNTMSSGIIKQSKDESTTPITITYSYNSQSLADTFYKKYKSAIADNLKNFYSKDTDFDIEDIDMSEIWTSTTTSSPWNSKEIRDSFINNNSYLGTYGRLNAGSLLDRLTTKIENKVKAMLDNSSIELPADFYTNTEDGYFTKVIAKCINDAKELALDTVFDTENNNVNLYALVTKYLSLLKATVEGAVNQWQTDYAVTSA